MAIMSHEFDPRDVPFGHRSPMLDELTDRVNRFDRARELGFHTEMGVQAEASRQIDRYIELGFHHELGVSEEEYRASFPDAKLQPEAYKGRFDIPLVVDSRISLRRQHELAGIRQTDPVEKIKNSTKVPEEPYMVWTHNGQRYQGLRAKEASQMFAKEEVGSPQVEVTALYLQHPEFFVGHWIEAAGSHLRYHDRETYGLLGPRLGGSPSLDNTSDYGHNVSESDLAAVSARLRILPEAQGSLALEYLNKGKVMSRGKEIATKE